MTTSENNTYPQIISEILSLLEKELPATLTYHGVSHTRDVLEEAERFARYDKLSQKDQELLLIAAAFHDSGFLDKSSNTERSAALRAAFAMKESGCYTKEEIALVCEMIEDTKLLMVDGSLVQVPRSSLAGYLLDADVSNLGRDDFLVKSELLFKEQGASSKRDFYRDTLNLIRAKVWFTPAARALREAKRLENLEKIVELTETLFTD